MRILIAMFVVLAGTTCAFGQTPFAGCGTLVDDSSGFACVHLMPDAGGGPLQLNGSLGSYQVGDYVYVEGTEFTICATFCWDPLGCIDVSFIGDCVTSVPFADCGTLVDDGNGCLVLETAGETYALDDIGSFTEGQVVFVEGDLEVMCVTTCNASSGCITGNTIAICPGEPFIRGDVDGDASFNGLVDGLFALSYQFLPGSPVPPCLEAADADNNGSFNGLTDGLYLLNFQFVPGSATPPAPYPDCGTDDDNALGCDVSACP